MLRRWRTRYELVSDEADGDTWTVQITVSSHANVPIAFDGVYDEADCVATVKAWLANLNEDGTAPADWDGWLSVRYQDHGFDGVLVFRPEEVKAFTCELGDTQNR